jgi:hypothetical protein
MKYELMRSFVYLCDLFTSTQQLTNLNDMCDYYLRNWFEEDDLMISLMSYGLCKSGILLGHTSKETIDVYVRLIERNFKFFSKTTAYACCLFLLESNEDDLTKSLLPILVQELNTDLISTNLKMNLDIRVNGWILGSLFHLIENNQQVSTDIFSLIFKDESPFETNDCLTQHMISIGYERLLLLGQYPTNEIWRLYKRSTNVLRQSTWFNIDHILLILARLYTSLKSNTEMIASVNKDPSNEEQEMMENSLMSTSSDNILIELVGEFYERIKQSHTLPYEAIFLLRPLPSLMVHHGLSDRLMNKMVVEFAASTQLYPQILAHTIFAVFRALIRANYSAKVNEWTLLSMTSVAQRKPIRMATWSLTCLMLSACPSHDIANTL